ncbi:uncharacterized protein LOC129947795 [Eupeodes corollae]|uniref:uncharacterized protein LOC129947795 n=1 Tax=Eupeodes corollae TaxID=290404 RepID=UPI002490AD5C|nr:uncharacterized protein LOC129947795 [Eupeodes corollae]
MFSIRIFLVFCMICLTCVRSSPLAIDVLENRDIIFPRRSELVKRTASNDVSELNHQKISLASFIENIETGILQTALSVDPLASDTHAEVQNTSTSPHPVEIRSTKEDTSVPIESSTAYVIFQTTENYPAVDSVPSHVVIDRVSVFKAPEAGSGLFPTFLVQDTNASSSDATEVNPEADDDIDEVEEGSTSANNSESSECEDSTESTESSKSSESSEEKSTKVKCSSAITTEKESSSTVSPSPSTSTSSTSTTLTVEEKKNAEKELKEKIGEIEAEPVIFTARV